MHLIRVYLLVLVLAALKGVYSKKLPSFITPCSRTDPKLVDCVKNEVQKLKPKLKEGLPEMHLPPLEPFFLESAGLENGGLSLALTKINLYGLADFKIDSLTLDLKNAKVDVNLMFPIIRMTGNYKIKGKILLLQLDGEGKAEGNITDTTSIVHCQGANLVKNGKTYLNFTRIDIDLAFGGGTLKFDDLFKDNPEVSDGLNKVINENAKDFLNELKPAAVQTISSIVFTLTKKVFDRYPIDELFTP